MSWPDDEWDGFCMLLEEWWKDEFADSTRIAWKYALDDTDPRLAISTLRLMLRRGETWRPSVAEFVATLEGSLSPAPSFDEAWPAITRAMRRYDPYTPSSVENVLSAVCAAAGETAAGWLSAFGVERMAAEPVDDPDYGGAVLKRLRDSWNEMTGRPEQRDRLVARLGGAGRGQLGRLDAAALLSVEPSVAIGAREDGN